MAPIVELSLFFAFKHLHLEYDIFSNRHRLGKYTKSTCYRKIYLNP